MKKFMNFKLGDIWSKLIVLLIKEINIKELNSYNIYLRVL